MSPSDRPEIHHMRKDYTLGDLNEEDMAESPLVQFASWFGEAINGLGGAKMELPDWFEPNAMTLSTADRQGRVSSRIVLLKDVEDEQFVFYTNYESDKAVQLAENPVASLCFFWPHLQRQVLIGGSVSKVDRERSERYFHSRPRLSQLGAHASQQSQVVASRQLLQEKMAALQKRYSDDQTVPLPDCWGGYALQPESIEFWQGRPSRLHDRLRYRMEQGRWILQRLSP